MNPYFGAQYRGIAEWILFAIKNEAPSLFAIIIISSTWTIYGWTGRNNGEKNK